MPTPKFRTSKSKRNMRRAHDALKVPTVAYCPNCSEVKHSHMVCSACGHYKGKQVMQARTSNAWEQGDDFKVEG